MNKGNAESRLDGLERNYITFQVNHEKILELENLDKTHVYFSTFLYDLVEDSFYDRKREFLNFLEGLKANTAAVAASNSMLRQFFQALLKPLMALMFRYNRYQN